MLSRGRRTIPRRRAGALTLTAIALALLLVAPVGSLAAPSPSPSTSARPATTTNGVTGSATWNGVNVATANTSSSAFQISFNGAVTVVYGWSQPIGIGPRWLINDARLQIFYFGFALGTRDITTTTGAATGNLTMGNWSTGPLQYILEGTYQLVASLLSPNGTTVWSEGFWVDVAAPFYILAVLPIVLILIAIYELYGVATVGKQARLKRQKQGGGPAPPPATPAAAAPPAAAMTAPPTEPAPSAEEPPDPAAVTPPPSGGTS
jgi:hypothetical protein